MKSNTVRTFRPREPVPPLVAESVPTGKLKGGFELPDALPTYPAEGPDRQPWLSRWDEGKWGVWATIKLLMPLALRALRSRISRRTTRQFWAELRRFMESMGALWIEVGLLLAKRPDLIGPVAQEEMALLRRPVNEFPMAVAESLFLKQFGVGIEDRFSRFDARPISIGLFSQTYRARLRDPDVEVAVKVLRPDAAALLARDLGILRTLIRLSRWSSRAGVLGLPKLAWEIEQRLIQSTDLRYQAAKMRRIRKSLKPHKVRTPRVFYAASSSHFLTAEFLDAPNVAALQGLAAADPGAAREWMRRNRISPRKLGRRIFQSFLRQAFSDNLFHSDLSPSNIILLRDSRFAIPTAGDVASLDKQFATYNSQMFRAIAGSDYSKAVDYLFLTCDTLPRVALNDLRVELVRLYRAFEMRSELHGVGFADRSFSALTSEVSAVMFRSGIARSWQGVNLDCGWTNLEQCLHFLDPDFSFRQELKRYFARLDRRNAAISGDEGIRIKVGRLVATLSEQAVFVSAQLRRRAQSLDGIGKASYIAAVFFRTLFRLLLLAVIGLIAARYGLLARLTFLQGTWVLRTARQVEHQPRILYWATVLVGLYAMLLIRNVIARLLQRERKA